MVLLEGCDSLQHWSTLHSSLRQHLVTQFGSSQLCTMCTSRSWDTLVRCCWLFLSCSLLSSAVFQHFPFCTERSTSSIRWRSCSSHGWQQSRLAGTSLEALWASTTTEFDHTTSLVLIVAGFGGEELPVLVLLRRPNPLLGWKGCCPCMSLTWLNSFSLVECLLLCGWCVITYLLFLCTKQHENMLSSCSVIFLCLQQVFISGSGLPRLMSSLRDGWNASLAYSNPCNSSEPINVRVQLYKAFNCCCRYSEQSDFMFRRTRRAWTMSAGFIEPSEFSDTRKCCRISSPRDMSMCELSWNRSRCHVG